MGRTTRSSRLQAPQDLANAQFLPQCPRHVDDPQRPRPLNVDSLPGWAHLWRDVEATRAHATNARGEAEKRLTIQSVGAAKVVDDMGSGAPLDGVPARLGELVVLYDGTVFVLAFGRPQIHAYTIGVSQRTVKSFFHSRVSMFCGCTGEDLPVFSLFFRLEFANVCLGSSNSGQTPRRENRNPAPRPALARPQRGGPWLELS